MVLNKHKNKRFAARCASLIGVLVILLCSVVPASAATVTDDDTKYSQLINVGRFDTVAIADEVVMPYAYYSIDDDGSTVGMSTQWYSEALDDYESVSWNCGNLTENAGVYVHDQVISCPGGNWQSIVFSASTPFLLTNNECRMLTDYFQIYVPAHNDVSVSISFTAYYPVLAPNGGYNWERVSNTYTHDAASSYAAGWYNFFPGLTAIAGKDVHLNPFAMNKGVYCTQFEVSISLYDTESLSGNGSISLRMPYLDPVNFYSQLEYFKEFPREFTVVYKYSDLEVEDLGSFLAHGVDGFFKLEIIPGLSLGGILAAIIGVLILLMFMRR